MMGDREKMREGYRAQAHNSSPLQLKPSLALARMDRSPRHQKSLALLLDSTVSPC
jgi:hypothetical protein